MRRWIRRGLGIALGPSLALVAFGAAGTDAGGTLQGLSQEGTRDDLSAVRKQLREPWPDARRAAVRKLVKMDCREAWELVLERLEDPAPEVADEAQLGLAKLRGGRALSMLLGRAGLSAKDPIVRLRAAEAIGRMQVPIDGEVLARALTPRRPELSSVVCWSLERLARRGTLSGDQERVAKRLESVTGRSQPERLRADGMAALAIISPERVERHLRSALHDQKHPLVRAAALTLIQAAGWPEAFARSAEASTDDDPVVRAAAYAALASAPRRAGLEVLVGRLEQEPRERLRDDLLRALRRVSGRLHGADPRPWRDWLATLPADWYATTSTAVVRPREQTVTRMSSFECASDRLSVLIDFSGSLWAQRSGGLTRKVLLDRELTVLLEGLPADAWFNLVPYADRPRPWKKALVPARANAVRAATRHLQACHLTGKGNVWDAVTLALEDPHVDRMLIVTDGAPTGGRHWNLELLVELLTWSRRWRGVAIDSLLVDTGPRLARHWQTLAERTGGVSVCVQFEGQEGERSLR